MHMLLTHRMQILLDEERHARLERLATAAGVSVASLVREAIDRAFPDSGGNRRQAADSILRAEPILVEDWAQMKTQMLDEMNSHGEVLAGQ